jgi:predicted nucleic acid-binding Zn ribbon protein
LKLCIRKRLNAFQHKKKFGCFGKEGFMYCATCGAPVTAGLSFCNRCGTSLKKDRPRESELGGGLIAAVVLVALLGLGIMLGGSIALKKGGEFSEGTVAFFMILTFAILAFVEVFLVRQLSRVLGAAGKRPRVDTQELPLFQPAMAPASEVRAAPLRRLPEGMPSVTENTTRTLESSFRQSLK